MTMSLALPFLQETLDAAIGVLRSKPHLSLTNFARTILTDKVMPALPDQEQALLRSLAKLVEGAPELGSRISTLILLHTMTLEGIVPNSLVEIDARIADIDSNRVRIADNVQVTSYILMPVGDLQCPVGVSVFDAHWIQHSLAESLLNLPQTLLVTSFSRDQLIALRDIVSFAMASGVSETQDFSAHEIYAQMAVFDGISSDAEHADAEHADAEPHNH